MNSNLPALTTEEIAALPDGHYLDELDEYHRKYVGMWFNTHTGKVGRIDSLVQRGGITARLVPEQDRPPVMQDMIEADAERNFAQAELLEAEAQRDRAVALLRQCFDLNREVAAGGPWAPGGDFDGEIAAFLAEQEPCKRCGGGKVLRWDEDDPEVEATVERTAPCPDCAEDIR